MEGKKSSKLFYISVPSSVFTTSYAHESDLFCYARSYALEMDIDTWDKSAKIEHFYPFKNSFRKEFLNTPKWKYFPKFSS